MERDAVQSAIAAHLCCHRADRLCGARGGVDAPELARAARHPGSPIGSKGHFHGFADHFRTGDGLESKAGGEARLRDGGSGECQGGDGGREKAMANGHSTIGGWNGAKAESGGDPTQSRTVTVNQPISAAAAVEMGLGFGSSGIPVSATGGRCRNRARGTWPAGR